MKETIFNVAAQPSVASDSTPKCKYHNEEIQSQKWYFNVALHRSTIWVLDKYIQVMRKIELKGADGKPVLADNGKPQVLEPTFEFIDLGSRIDSFEALKVLGNVAIAASVGDPNHSDIQNYVDTAVNKMSGSQSMYLPNVADFPKPTTIHE